MSFHNNRHVKGSRKTRRCDWCGQQIERGNPYIYASGVFEGDFYTGRYHTECSAAITRYYTINKCWGEEMPDYAMNRGGIEERGEPEKFPLDLPTVAPPPEPISKHEN